MTSSDTSEFAKTDIYIYYYYIISNYYILYRKNESEIK